MNGMSRHVEERQRFRILIFRNPSLGGTMTKTYHEFRHTTTNAHSIFLHLIQWSNDFIPNVFYVLMQTVYIMCIYTIHLRLHK